MPFYLVWSSKPWHPAQCYAITTFSFYDYCFYGFIFHSKYQQLVEKNCPYAILWWVHAKEEMASRRENKPETPFGIYYL